MRITIWALSISPALFDMLRQWWKAARPQGWLFPGRPPVNPLTYRQLNRIFHLAAEAAEIRKGATLHTLRHSFATHLLESKRWISTGVSPWALRGSRLNDNGAEAKGTE